ncbi:hypothetical protein Barb7_02133 [Bacteroidales bacterium Barb7]|nr:hypothetical protein Barb7_02133 [Bacteroidales bacterium Barb7]
MGEKGFELAVKLGSQGLVVAQYQSRLLYLLDDIGNGKGFPRTGHSQQSLERNARPYSFGKRSNCFGLVAGGTERGR